MRVDVDLGAEGTIDEVVRHYYDASGNLLRAPRDTNGDGFADASTWYDYDCLEMP